MNGEWWKNAVQRFPRLHLRDDSKSDHARRPGNRKATRNEQHGWWEATADEAHFWPEDEHIERRQRMDRLERGLDKLRGRRPGRGSRN